MLADVRQRLLDDVHDLDFVGRRQRQAIANRLEARCDPGLPLELLERRANGGIEI